MFGKVFTHSCVAMLAVAAASTSYTAAAQQAAANAKIPMPPMGWSSWNAFSNTISSAVAQAQAQAMVSSGLKNAGYEYVNIDEGWWLGDRDAQGNIVVDGKAWPAIEQGEQPGDMSNIVRFIHKLGLKAGIYTDAGKDGCSMYPDLGPAYSHVGSEGHYQQDFLQFARWGFDYVKVDWCGGDKENLDPDVQYSEIARAIEHAALVTGHRLYYSICNWGKESPWTWGPGVGGATQSIWRTSGDIVAPVVAGSVNAGRKVSFEKMLANFDQGIHPEAEHTGFYNDPDMMVLAMPGMNAAQDRLHMALWAISGAPLLIGADLTRLDADALAAFTNADAIRIDQDALGLQAIKARELAPGLEVWSKFLATPGERAVLLLNRTYFPAPMSLQWSDLGLAGDAASVREVWTAKDLGSVQGAYKTVVPAQDGILLIVKGSEGNFKQYVPAGQHSGDRATRFTGVSATERGWAQARVHYRNSSADAHLVDLTVNEQGTTRVAFPPTGADEGSVWIEVNLDRQGDGNILDFSNYSEPGLAITGLDVH